MDIPCPKCSEPWDIDEFHDIAEEQGITWDDVRKNFAAKGCEALGMSPCTPDNSLRSQASAVVMELLGDDLDGAASLMDDFEFMGMLDE